jgi:D-glycerate 3-kinase
MKLARSLFAALKTQSPTAIPQYDKSAFAGQGDRIDASNWDQVNLPHQPKIAVIILEGWSVGFRSLSDAELLAKAHSSALARSGTLYRHEIAHLRFVNDKLKEYDVLTDTFDAFIHIDAEETKWVYEWRLQQEGELRRENGTGMTDEEVVRFVDGYYPAYELFTDELRKGVIKGEGMEGRQLRFVVGRDRKVKEVIMI